MLLDVPLGGFLGRISSELPPVLKLNRIEIKDPLPAKKRMNGEDVYGRKITVCLPDESPFHLNNKKWTSYLTKRNESPSPQGRRPRERYNSRSYTPEEKSGCNDYILVPASQMVDRKGYKTPGGPVRAGGAPSVGMTSGIVESPVSPSHTHTLPNSNSAKYYTKSELLTPSDFLEKSGKDTPPLRAQMDEARALLEKLNMSQGANSGLSGSAPQQMSLKDIPLPPSGYQFMPPPNMISIAPPVASGTGPESKAASLDPVALFETTSKDSQLQKPGLLGPVPTTLTSNQLRPQASKFNPGAYFKHPEPAVGGDAGFKKDCQHQQQNPHHQHHQHQGRSLSVPGSEHQQSNNDGFVRPYGPPAGGGGYRSHSHTGPPGRTTMAGSGGYKKQDNAQQQIQPRTRHQSGGYNRRQSPANRPASTGQTLNRQSPTVNSTNRTYSPIPHTNRDNANQSPNMNNKGFRPRLPSAPTASAPGTMGFLDSGKRSPSPFAGLPAPIRPPQRQRGSNIYRVPTPVEIGDPSSDYFNPDFQLATDSYVELIVSNLDYNISPLDWRKVIFATFQPHVKILSIQVRLQADNTSVATLRLPTEQEARFAISQFHRRKIGYKRINVQLKADCSQSPGEALRMDTIALLMEEKDNKMALSRLIDLFDKRFHKTVSVSDVYKMRDTIQIMEVGGGGRWVKLQPGIKRTPTPNQNADGEVIDALESPVCTIHCAEGSECYVEALNSCMLPSVLMLRKHFSPQLHSLLLSHNGYIPLMSFPACYAAEFRPIEPEQKGGIPLEHVISCVPGVEICVSKAGVKVIQFQQNREPFYDMMKGTAWQELGKISREVMELLRQQLTCSMPVSKFIPAYHHYYGKQCRVADYGYTKLQELFEAIPHAIQVLGTGDRKMITLSPRAQLKRFTTDIVKVVKAQPTKQIMLDKFAAAYEEVMGKPLLLAHYGVCYMEDILSEIPTTTLIVIEEAHHILLALPRRDQTPEEVERTKKFSLEVVDLLKTCPQCCMPFNKFIPAYHHHFGRQCRVADYGFSKLADLFEAVSHIVRLEEEGEERMIQLTLTEMRAVLVEQLTSLLRPAGAIPVGKIQQAYGNRFNYGLKLSDYGAETTRSLLLQLKNHVRIETYNGQEYATLVKEFQIPALGLQVMQLLMDESGGCLPLQELCTKYQSMFGRQCDLAEIRDKLSDYIQIEDSASGGGIIRLSLQQSLGRNLRLLLLHQAGQKVAMSDLYRLYRQQYGVELSPALYGFPSLYQLLLSFPHILELRGKPSHKQIVLSGMLATPGVLPPARVDVTSPQQFTSPKETKASEPGGAGTNTAFNSATNPSPSPSSGSDLLIHASQLWDSAIISQSPPCTTVNSVQPGDSNPAASTRIMNMLSASAARVMKERGMPSTTPTTTTTPQEAPSSQDAMVPMTSVTPNKFKVLSPNGVPVEWQMSPGGGKIMSGNLVSPAKLEEAYNGSNLDETENWEKDSEQSEQNDQNPFSSGNLPLETSSTTSSHFSSSCSQSPGSNASPVKRVVSKPRIAANFNKPQ
ncbi:meiosis arrest female protein 1 homolog [Elysia marginata]|uniref:Meiosis arrest female protein 1 homolog n=1 Tax=Elysia marginata TaxID=1093978 RepID=A0AAV4H1E2_9GAST|nr:meiosis arrest female protein 1 homolog [Elysia marginata]